MKTYNVKKTFRNAIDNRPIETKIVGTVTAYTITEAMRKASEKFNDGSWNNISV